MAWNSSSVILSPERKDLSAARRKENYLVLRGVLGKQFKQIFYNFQETTNFYT
jgi:hypothetical protein